MTYTEVTIRCPQSVILRELLIDALGNEGPYDSFVELTDSIKAYVSSDQYSQSWLQEQVDAICSNIQVPLSQVYFHAEELPDRDYNQEWEQSHQPVLVDGFCWVRAPFHPHRDDVKYEIEIEPKMSFGTAHHATTCLMLAMLEDESVEGRRVLDMGTGTGVLAILAAMKGASYVEAIDPDEWAFRNAQENFERNHVVVTPLLGDAMLLTSDKHFDIVMANINRNILLRDMKSYVDVLNAGGVLILSGFYEHDVQTLKEEAVLLGLLLDKQITRDDWTALKFTKQGS